MWCVSCFLSDDVKVFAKYLYFEFPEDGAPPLKLVGILCCVRFLVPLVCICWLS